MVWKRDRGRERDRKGWREPMSAYSLNGRILFTWLTCSRFIRLWPWRVQWQFCISYASSAPTLTDLSLKLRVKTNFRIVNAFSWCKCAQTVRESALSYQRSHTHTHTRRCMHTPFAFYPFEWISLDPNSLSPSPIPSFHSLSHSASALSKVFDGKNCPETSIYVWLFTGGRF